MHLAGPIQITTDLCHHLRIGVFKPIVRRLGLIFRERRHDAKPVASRDDVAEDLPALARQL